MSSQFSDSGIPTLTQRAGQANLDAGGTTAPDTVLRALLQAELEQAIEQAAADMRARLETELPGIVERALQRLRPG